MLSLWQHIGISNSAPLTTPGGSITEYPAAGGTVTAADLFSLTCAQTIPQGENVETLNDKQSVVCCLPQMGIANRDIKLENTLLMDLSEKPVLKLCDFGYSKDELCASISKTMCGKLSRLISSNNTSMTSLTTVCPSTP